MKPYFVLVARRGLEGRYGVKFGSWEWGEMVKAAEFYESTDDYFIIDCANDDQDVVNLALAQFNHQRGET